MPGRARLMASGWADGAVAFCSVVFVVVAAVAVADEVAVVDADTEVFVAASVAPPTPAPPAPFTESDASPGRRPYEKSPLTSVPSTLVRVPGPWRRSPKKEPE